MTVPDHGLPADPGTAVRTRHRIPTAVHALALAVAAAALSVGFLLAVSDLVGRITGTR